MKNYLKQNICRALGWALLAGIICQTGCQTADQADSGKMASVTISGHTDKEIERAAARAFSANHYQQMDHLTFEKQGTGWDRAKYGGWSSDPVWIRMRINITSAGASQSTLACDAYVIVDRNAVGTEEEKKLSVAYRSECKKILDEAKMLLDSAPSAVTP